jgi:hypothetical protein
VVRVGAAGAAGAAVTGQLEQSTERLSPPAGRLSTDRLSPQHSSSSHQSSHQSSAPPAILETVIGYADDYDRGDVAPHYSPLSPDEEESLGPLHERRKQRVEERRLKALQQEQQDEEEKEAERPPPSSLPPSSEAVLERMVTREEEVTRDMLLQFYRRHDPAKISDIDAILAHYSQSELHTALLKKYGTVPRVATQHVPTQHVPTQHTPGGSSSSSPRPLTVRKAVLTRASLEAYYQQVCTTTLSLYCVLPAGTYYHSIIVLRTTSRYVLYHCIAYYQQVRTVSLYCVLPAGTYSIIVLRTTSRYVLYHCIAYYQQVCTTTVSLYCVLPAGTYCIIVLRTGSSVYYTLFSLYTLYAMYTIRILTRAVCFTCHR